MQKCWTLDRVVEEVFKEELDSITDEKLKETVRGEHYEKARKFLTEVLVLVGFNINFLKEEGGYANRGTYKIPALDCDFFEDLIKNRNDKFFKIIKTGRFYGCDQEKLLEFIDRLCEVLKHLDINPDLIQFQRKLMEQKTYVYMGLPFKRMTDINNMRMQMICEILTTGTDLLSHDEVCDYLADLEKSLDAFYGSWVGEFRRRSEAKKEEMKKTHLMVDIEDAGFSERTNRIMDILAENPEFVSLQKERETLFFIEGKMTAQRRRANEKRRIEIDKRMNELYREVASKEPMVIEELTPVEQYMMLCGNEGFKMHMCKEEKKMLLYQSDRYYLQDQIHNTMYLGQIEDDIEDDDE